MFNTVDAAETRKYFNQAAWQLHDAYYPSQTLNLISGNHTSCFRRYFGCGHNLYVFTNDLSQLFRLLEVCGKDRISPSEMLTELGEQYSNVELLMTSDMGGVEIFKYEKYKPMKASELIKFLDNIIQTHGDASVYYCDYIAYNVEPILSAYPSLDQHGKIIMVTLDNGKKPRYEP
jgi:hypothetical protein